MRPRSNAGAEGGAVVLVAEDELLVRKVVLASLELARYKVLVAEDGLEALEFPATTRER
jgi:CheY-like chemotaxis protein